MMKNTLHYDAIVVGGGIAGLTAAAYLAKAGKKVILFERQAKTGGLVQTFQRNGIYFDGGLRSIENSGIVFPMLKQLGIEIEFFKSPVTIGIADEILKLTGKDSVEDYDRFLKNQFPDNKEDITAIIGEIRKIMGYMDVLYGIDNPAFLNMMEEKKYLLTVILPWMFKFLFTIGKIYKLDEPADEYLARFTKNQALNDIIAQHFFQKTPASFALSYFSLYLDYHYPKGGTATLINKMEEFILKQGGEIRTSVLIEELHPEERTVTDQDGNKFGYQNLIWAGDIKQLYNKITVETLKDKKLIKTVEEKRKALKDLKGCDSVYTIYLSVNEDRSYFDKILTGHAFYTPDKRGLSSVSKTEVDEFLKDNTITADDIIWKEKVISYLIEYFKLNTFEIAIPVLRDETLAPPGQAGLVVSLLYDYTLAKKIEDLGWSNEIKYILEKTTIDILEESIFPGIKDKVFGCFSSSPVTIEKLTGNTEGGITGWAFTNSYIPAVNKMLAVNKAVDTPLPHIFQAGQWSYSPAGLPISILTGKLAVDKVLKNK